MKTTLSCLGLAAMAFAAAIALPSAAIAGIPDLGHLFPTGGGAAPEIDPSAIAGVLALVFGGTAMLTDRFRG